MSLFTSIWWKWWDHHHKHATQIGYTWDRLRSLEVHGLHKYTDFSMDRKEILLVAKLIEAVGQGGLAIDALEYLVKQGEMSVFDRLLNKLESIDPLSVWPAVKNEIPAMIQGLMMIAAQRDGVSTQQAIQVWRPKLVARFGDLGELLPRC